ncbi:MAG: ATP-dependent RecD-like DNA helicase [Candidatus Omnitrophica bacterium]|nr:ATP-dependent RecD-like DNA helicase [Candidatus Omnitrophota bacterium]
MEQSITLSPDQEHAKNAVLDWWYEDNRQEDGGLIKLAGYAGTGKTTLLSTIIREIHESTVKDSDDPIKVAYCAFTGKAANILRSKLELNDDDFCGTIHSLIYRPILDSKERLKGWAKCEALEYDLIVIDEASMVNEDIFKDLWRYGIPIIAVGDHGQLPPVTGEFNLMAKPDVRLEHIHRQAADNPIIQVAHMARRDGKIHPRVYGPGVYKIETSHLYQAIADTFDPKALYLCAFNATRSYVNKVYRERIGLTSEKPVKGEKVICLRNNKKAGIFNGMTGILKSIQPHEKDYYVVDVEMDDDNKFGGLISRFQFGQKDVPKDWNVYTMGNLFDWGYCLTVHKAQGSEADKVILIEQRGASMDDDIFAKWLYTAVTRAKKELLIIKQVRE